MQRWDMPMHFWDTENSDESANLKGPQEGEVPPSPIHYKESCEMARRAVPPQSPH